MGAHKDQIQSNYTGNGSKSMKLSLEASLKKLQTSYIDLFYVHWWDFTTTMPELMHSLNDLIVSGRGAVPRRLRYTRLGRLQGQRVRALPRTAPIVVYQGMWNAAMRDFERDIIPMTRDEGMGLCP